MGSTNHVKDAAHMRFEQSYQFYNAKGIDRLLRDFPKLRLKAYETGDMAAVDIRLDLERAIQIADLTEKQARTMDLIYNHDMTATEAAEYLGVDTSTVSRTRKTALNKIAAVYRLWNYLK